MGSQVQAMLDTYGSKYHDLKAPRKLKWRPALGSVTLTIRVGSDTLDLTVTPLHATIIMHFQVTITSPFCLAQCSCKQFAGVLTRTFGIYTNRQGLVLLCPV